VADRLSRRPMDEKEVEREEEDDIDDFIDAELDFLCVALLVRETRLIVVLLTVKVFPFGFEESMDDKEERDGNKNSKKRGKEEEERPEESSKWRNLMEESAVDTSLSTDYSTKAGFLDSSSLAPDYFVEGTNGIGESAREELEGENSA
jgi:hypothetical protein